MAEIQFCPESIVSEIFSKVGKEENKENRENQNHARIASTADILQQLNQNVPEQFIDALSEQMEAELGEVSEIGENEFLSIFQNWLISMSNSDGSYFDQSFADMCSSSFSAVDISLLSQGPLTPLSEIKLNYQNGFGGSPARTLKEATSMELCNSKLNSEIELWKSKANQYQSDYEKLIVTSEQTEKELRSTQQKLENCEKQVKMVRITNDNLNADLDHLNELREIDKVNLGRIEELEIVIKNSREENEKAWNMVNNLRTEKDDLLTEIEDEKANFILLKQEMTLMKQETLREQKELIRQKEISQKRANDSEGTLLQFNRDIASLTRERDELKSVIRELESRIEENGEVIQFTEGCLTDRSTHQKTLHDELDQSNDYRTFKLEEIGAIKVELDQTQNDLRQVNARNVELEDQTRRLKNEMKTISKIHNSTSQTNFSSKQKCVRNAQTNTDELPIEIPEKKSKLLFRDWIISGWIGLLAMLICTLWYSSRPLLEINCPGVGISEFF